MHTRLSNVPHAGPQTPPVPFGAHGIEQHFRFPMRTSKTSTAWQLLDGTIFRPADELPRPALIINHGMPFTGDFHALPRYRFSAASQWFVEQGFVVAVPMRRGYGASDGDCVEGIGNSDDPDFYWAGQSTANDIMAVIACLRSLPYVLPQQIVVLGQSAGGWGALAVAGRNPHGVAAVIAVAPGRGGQEPGTISYPQRLLDSAARFGSTASMPVLWLSAANDQVFSQEWSHAMFRAFTSSLPQDKHAEFVALPAYGRDGHQVFKEKNGRAAWCPPVEHFLRSHGIWPVESASAATVLPTAIRSSTSP